MIYKKLSILLTKFYLSLTLIVPTTNLYGDMLDYYMMAVLPSMAANQHEPVIVPKSSSDPAVNIASYHGTTVNLINTYTKYDDSNAKLIKIASGNFTQSVDTYNMASAEMEAFSQEWIANLDKAAATMLYINYLNELQTKIPENFVETGVVIQPRGVFVTAFLFAGIALGLQQGMEYTYNSIKDYNKIGENTISNASGEELEDINVNVLQIKRDATAQEALAKYNSWDFMTKARNVSEISQSNAESGNGQTEPERKVGFTNLTKKLGRAAVTTTVGLEVSVTGGQLIDKVAVATGASANAAAVIDFAVTVSGKQPLDYVIMATESKDKTTKIVPPSTMTNKEAVETLDKARKEESLEIEDVIEAGKKIANETARLVPGADILPDGSVEIELPDTMDLRLIAKLDPGETTVGVRDLSVFDIVMLSEGMYPIRFDDINKTTIENLHIGSVELPQCPIFYTPAGSSFRITINEHDKDKDGWNEDRTYCSYWSSGDLSSQSPIVDDLYHGVHIDYSSPGVLDDIDSYAYDKLHGLSINYDQYGNIMSQKDYTEGVLNGLSISFYYSQYYVDAIGQVASISNYIDGVKRYQKNYSTTEILDYEVYYNADGRKDGIEKRYYYTGELKTAYPFVDGLAHGLAGYYYQSGQIANEIPYIDGMINGIVKNYYESGALASTKAKVDNELHGESRSYAEDGRLTQCSIYDMGTIIGSCMP